MVWQFCLSQFLNMISRSLKNVTTEEEDMFMELLRSIFSPDTSSKTPTYVLLTLWSKIIICHIYKAEPGISVSKSFDSWNRLRNDIQVELYGLNSSVSILRHRHWKETQSTILSCDQIYSLGARIGQHWLNKISWCSIPSGILLDTEWVTFSALYFCLRYSLKGNLSASLRMPLVSCFLRISFGSQNGLEAL